LEIVSRARTRRGGIHKANVGVGSWRQENAA
jgi:hypothetical protein